MGRRCVLLICGCVKKHEMSVVVFRSYKVMKGSWETVSAARPPFSSSPNQNCRIFHNWCNSDVLIFCFNSLIKRIWMCFLLVFMFDVYVLVYPVCSSCPISCSVLLALNGCYVYLYCDISWESTFSTKQRKTATLQIQRNDNIRTRAWSIVCGFKRCWRNYQFIKQHN